MTSFENPGPAPGPGRVDRAGIPAGGAVGGAVDGADAEAVRKAAAVPEDPPAPSGPDAGAAPGAPSAESAPASRKRTALRLLPVAALCALALSFGGIYVARGDGGAGPVSSMTLDEQLPYPTELRRVLAEVQIDARAARAIAAGRHAGPVVAQSLRTTGGHAQWEVAVLCDSGHLRRIHVDPGNGRVLDAAVDTYADPAEVRAAAGAPVTAAAVAELVDAAGRTPVEIAYDADAREWAVASYQGGERREHRYSARTGEEVA
ncbi:hypothetical protein ACFQLX_21970 [Streptomyces polyrhachis]|uniref:PepSY domain-containing protein n=1 Tax=Streptomyces polyrhachis TaxID=1282885 RepID=A0ABW2GMS3_9ACTN